LFPPKRADSNLIDDFSKVMKERGAWGSTAFTANKTTKGMGEIFHGQTKGYMFGL
jgi:hypothetical protein